MPQFKLHPLQLATAVLLCASAAPALADDLPFSIYGRVDVGVSWLQDVTAANAARVNNVKDSSTGRWGIKGAYDLGAGKQVFAQLENRFFADTGVQDSTAQWKDKAWVGFSTAEFGELRMGRMSSPIDEAGVNGRFEAFGGDSLASNGSRGAKYVAKWDNAVYFKSLVFNGFKAGAAVGVGEGAKTNATGLQGEYGQGPLVLSVATQTDSSAATSASFAFDTTTGLSKAVAATPADEWRTVSVGASYDFGKFKLMTTWAQSRDVGTKDLGVETVMTLGVAVPVGPGQVRASYRDITDDQINSKDRTADVSHQRLGLGYWWPIHKNASINFSVVSETYKKGAAASNSASSAEVALRLSF